MTLSTKNLLVVALALLSYYHCTTAAATALLVNDDDFKNTNNAGNRQIVTETFTSQERRVSSEEEDELQISSASYSSPDDRSTAALLNRNIIRRRNRRRRNTRRPTSFPTPATTSTTTTTPRPTSFPTTATTSTTTTTPRPTAAPTTRAPTKTPTKGPTKAPTPATTVQNSNGFNIQLEFSSPITEAQRSGFVRAVAKWTSVITADHAATVSVQAGQNFCGHVVKQNMYIDDLLIFVKVESIDGVGRIAGSAGPCALDGAGKVRIGVMTFDSADADSLISAGAWDATIMHEMGHVLGTLWDYENLITPAGQAPPYYYLGSNGNAGLATVQGEPGKVVVEDQGGGGTARAHWKEATYDNELMTGYLEGGGRTMPLSLITTRALQDLGYVVDVSKADAYSVPSTSTSGRRLRTRVEDKIPVGNDIFKTEIVVLDDSVLQVKKGRDDEFKATKAKYEERRRRRQAADGNKD